MELITQLPAPVPPPGRLDPARIGFGKMFTPHYFVADYRAGAWRDARIVGLEPFAIHPAALCLHYAQEIFEGLKAYRQPDGSVAVFRAGNNARRFRRSAERMSIPPVDEQLFLDAVHELVRLERDWVPPAPGSLYIRPAIIATQPEIGVHSSSEYKFFVLALPSGNYFGGEASGAGAIEVLISESLVRAWKGGTGAAKTAANYALTLEITARATAQGCHQVLFLDASPEHRVEELGGMNVLFVDHGALVTPPLGGTILDGVTRDSILALAADQGLAVREYAHSLSELVSGIEQGSISEAMACGTAAVVTGIHSFRFENGRRLKIGSAAPGPVTTRLFEELTAIHYGQVKDRRGWNQPVA